ncbi:MAG: FkbM family methyltransferase, partial [Cyanobacteria bacterium P01_F01_bin.4]
MFEFLHALVGLTGQSTGDRGEFLGSNAHGVQLSCQISQDSLPFWRDHCVYGQVIVPATAFVEMALTSARAVLTSKSLMIEDLVIQKALFLTDEITSVYLSLKAEDESAIPFQILSASAVAGGAHDQTLHVSGQLRSLDRPLGSPQCNLALRAEQLSEMSVEGYYQNCRARGIDYGVTFQVIRQLWRDHGEALGQIQLPDALTAGLATCQVHPVLLDSCLQVLWAALPQVEAGKTYLPIGMERLKVYGSPPAKVWGHARIRAGWGASSQALMADLCLFDDQGDVLVELEGVLIGQVTDETLSQRPQSGLRSRAQAGAQVEQTLAIAATFTAEPIEDSLDFWMQELDLPYRSEFAPYNQVFQTLLNPDSLLGQNSQGVNVILARLEDWDCPKATLQLQVDAAERDQALAGQPSYALPNRLEIAHLNQYETEYLYQEIFLDKVYSKHGVVLKDGDCVVDVGANIGLFTLFAQQQCPNGDIYAFEPAPHAFDKLQRNATLYCQNAHLFNCGLSSDNRTETFTFYPNSSVFSSFSADAEADEKAIRAVIVNMLQRDSSLSEADMEALAAEFLSDRLKRETYQAQLRSLSSVIDEYGIERIDLLKLDAEKSELPVLQGIRDEHWPMIQQIVVEVHDQVGDIIAEVQRILQAKGFNWVIDEEALLQ